MSTYFSKTRLLVHPMASNPPMPKISSQSLSMAKSQNSQNEGKLSILLKLASEGKGPQKDDEGEDQTEYVSEGSLKLGDFYKLYKNHTQSMGNLQSPREAMKKLQLSPSYINPSKKLTKIKLDDFIGKFFGNLKVNFGYSLLQSEEYRSQ